MSENEGKTNKQGSSKPFAIHPAPTQIKKESAVPEEFLKLVEERVANSQPIKRMIVENFQRI